MLFGCFWLFFIQIKAQSLISFGGNAAVGSEFSAAWSVGEVAVSTAENGKKVATQGFQQPGTVTVDPVDTATIGPIWVNTITPNGDGQNDFFVIENAENQPQNRLVIWDRWLETVFERDGYQNDWDGSTTSGKSLPEAVYFYAFYPIKSSKKHISGTITVIREH